ncbi:MAG: DUF294 nucleotidyltransferase-like domain-containing protein [Paracoccus sp. (in: a-proteobacteria)]|uniref:DUF294 nucleotidyltransferase-like domain-containing protein n=1 Tax=Paracoccus sp. TaxID=267 RepID=UPI0026DF33CD|nr:DUF294 nucleotidyltransferase-like domain-containing protein [Paracoccus sp. (in: a-proteobacteria)]MDO5612165.1 DUF294 nucleotidyltransferase-like domain-containing protein [Paracoccus sp. (in: a-proteobacteria)]
MEQITAFIGTVHPYDSLSRDELARVAGSFSRRDYAAGEPIYAQGDLLPGLYLIESGQIAVTDANGDSVSELGPRNSFGERGLLRDGVAVTNATAATASTVLMLPRDTVLELIASTPAVARFFDRGKGPADRGAPIATLKVSELLGQGEGGLSCSPDTTVVQAAQQMRDAHVSSLGVTDAGGALIGIVTIRDMSNRVVADGMAGDTPVHAVMTANPITLSPASLGYDVLNLMLERRIGHLPVVESGRFVGMITQTDLMRVQAVSASVLIREVADARNVAEMASVTRRIPELLLSLVASHQRHEVITRMITDIADAVTRRLLRLAEDRLGPPPAAWLWAACGSQGRQEQTGVSDQDNCLILAEGADADDPYFAELARIVSDGLHECGYVYCPGDMMATNPRWRQPLPVWRSYFRGWIDKPSPEAQMLASVMFDLRAIGGDASLLDGLHTETLDMAARNSIFVAHMVSNSLKHRPPLGLIGGFATVRSGEHRNEIDMKMNGVVPITDLARVYALQGRLTAVNTRARLEAATESGVVSQTGGRDLIAAYDLIQTMRLEGQAAEVRAGKKPDNYLAPAALPDFERSHLRDAFVVVRGMQSAIGHGKGMLG